MSRQPTRITLAAEPAQITFERAALSVGQATALLIRAKQRREDRLLQASSFDQASYFDTLQEEAWGPKPKGVEL